jgi:hypothetical protein
LAWYAVIASRSDAFTVVAGSDKKLLVAKEMFRAETVSVPIVPPRIDARIAATFKLPPTVRAPRLNALTLKSENMSIDTSLAIASPESPKLKFVVEELSMFKLANRIGVARPA